MEYKRAHSFEDERDFASMCEDRKDHGYNSGARFARLPGRVVSFLQQFICGLFAAVDRYG